MSNLTDDESHDLMWAVACDGTAGDTSETFAAVERIVADRERAARAEAWDEGKHSEHTPACRLGDVPDECTCPNPYREETRP